MTYLRDGAEHLTADELNVYRTIQRLTASKRTGNNSQISSSSHLPRTTVGKITSELEARGFIRNIATGAAYHWRVTSLPIPYPVEARQAALAEKNRQRELNEQIRTDRITAQNTERVTVPDEPVNWAGRGFGELSADEKRRAARKASQQMERELQAMAPAISAVLDDGPHTVSTFDGQRKIATGTFPSYAIASRIARSHREAGYTTRVRPAGLDDTECCDECS